jgi:hypothetical protein
MPMEKAWMAALVAALLVACTWGPASEVAEISEAVLCAGCQGLGLLDVDDDGDGFCEDSAVCSSGLPGDCDDSDPTVHPAQNELCDGLDNNCDGVVPVLETDQDGDRWVRCSPWLGAPAVQGGGDCDDADPTRSPGWIEACDGIDNDCDGAPDPLEADLDGDGARGCGGATPADCDDQNAQVHPGMQELCDGLDNDCDGMIDEYSSCPYEEQLCADTAGFWNWCGSGCGPATCERAYPGTICPLICVPLCECGAGMVWHAVRGCVPLVDADGDGVGTCGEDCDDIDPSRHPGAVEICDGVDNDCNLMVDDGPDVDGDGVGVCDCDDSNQLRAPTLAEACDLLDNDCNGAPGLSEVDRDLDGWFVCHGDCDDNDAGVHPTAMERCLGGDDDCDGVVDNAPDQDGDGVGRCAGDCDDWDAARSPSATEVCDGIDNDCDGIVDDAPGCSCPDADGDGICNGADLCWGDDSSGDADLDGYCAMDTGGAGALDCDDNRATVWPGAPELCDGVDNDCDGAVPSAELDQDGDGSRPCEGDCDDNDASVAPPPTGVELCDGIDNNCDGRVDEGFDVDGDGVTSCAGDCDDLNATVLPGAPEGCDGIDTDCDGAADPTEVDQDGDGTLACGGDCDDQEARVHPGALELCDGLDNDCDGLLGPGEVDDDGDGVWLCGGDCDDGQAGVFPGQTELCDGIDNNCDGQTDEGLSFVDYFADADGDGYGDPGASPVPSCSGPPAGMVADNTDCDDTAAEVHPGAAEIACDAIDNDCAAETLDEIDGDGDGSGECSDCDDGEATVNPAAPELCGDGIDNDCDGSSDEDCPSASDPSGCGACSGAGGGTSSAPWALLLVLAPLGRRFRS